MVEATPDRSIFIKRGGPGRPITPAEKFCYLARKIHEKRRIFAALATQTGPDYSPEKNRRRHNKLYQERDQTRDHERNCPEQVEVEPRLTEKCEA